MQSLGFLNGLRMTGPAHEITPPARLADALILPLRFNRAAPW